MEESTLHSKLIAACEYYIMKDKYNSAIAEQEKYDRQYDKKLEELRRKGFSAVKGVLAIVFSTVGAWLVFVFLSIVSLEYLPDSFDKLSFSYAICLSIPLAALIAVGGALVYKKTYCRIKTKKIQAECKKYWDEVLAPEQVQIRSNIYYLKNERDQFINKYNCLLDFIPEYYRTKLAVAYLENVVKNGRADNLKEALNLYEEQLHRWELEEQSRTIAQQNYYLSEQLSTISSNQREIASSLRHIENLEFYNTFCR